MESNGADFPLDLLLFCEFFVTGKSFEDNGVENGIKVRFFFRFNCVVNWGNFGVIGEFLTWEVHKLFKALIIIILYHNLLNFLMVILLYVTGLQHQS